MPRENVLERISKGKLIVIARGLGEDRILPLAEALAEGGIRMLEITFPQHDPAGFSVTTNAIAAVRKRISSDMHAGAGTVMNKEQLAMAQDAGALYIISPHTDPELIRETRARGLVSIPGALSASESVAAHNAGADCIKLFPSGSMGPGYFKELCAPLSHLRFLGVGGIGLHNIRDFLKAGAAGFGVGSLLANRELVDAGKFGEITDLAKRFVQAVAE
jgi:2-dehydro-3-deoxyphosphogluconate aldolase/(4S)-4-hydroxy-2-oxoglutarate aldolase